MLNLIKMDLYRLVRSKSFWVMIIVTAVVAFISAFATNFSFESIENIADPEIMSGMGLDMDEETANSMSIGLTAEFNELDNVLGGEKVYFTEYFNYDLSALTVLIFCAIFPPIFVNAEQKYGFIKNIAGQLSNRGMLVIPKLCAVAVQVIVIFAVYIITSSLSCNILFGERLVFDFSGEFIKVFALHFFLHYAFAVLVTAATIFLRGSALSMTMGIIVSGGVTSFIYSFADIILHKAGFSEDFSIGDFALETCVGDISTQIAGIDLARVISVGTVFLIASVALSMITMYKRDVK